MGEPWVPPRWAGPPGPCRSGSEATRPGRAGCSEAEPGFARRESRRRPDERGREGGGSWGNHGFPHVGLGHRAHAAPGVSLSAASLSQFALHAWNAPASWPCPPKRSDVDRDDPLAAHDRIRELPRARHRPRRFAAHEKQHGGALVDRAPHAVPPVDSGPEVRQVEPDVLAGGCEHLVEAKGDGRVRAGVRHEQAAPGRHRAPTAASRVETSSGTFRAPSKRAPSRIASPNRACVRSASRKSAEVRSAPSRTVFASVAP